MIKFYRKQNKFGKFLLIFGVLLVVGYLVTSLTPCSDGKSCLASISEGFAGSSNVQIEEEVLPVVEIVNIGEFQKNNFAVSATGQVESANQVDLISQVQEKVKSVKVTIGQEVSAGQTLVVFENETALAQLMQAEAGLEVAQAQLAEMERGARPEQLKIVQDQVNSAKVNYEQAQVNLENTYSSAKNALISAADLAKNTVLVVTDLQYKYFDDYYLESVNLAEKKSLAVSKLLGQENAGRWDIRAISKADSGAFNLAKTANSQEEIDFALVEMQEALRRVKDMLNAVLTYRLNVSDNTALSIEKSTINGQVSSINGIDSLILAAEINLSQAKSGYEQAQNQLDLTLAGATEEQLISQRAAVKSAQASLIQVRALYNKTIIVSPISGKVASLPVKISELVNPSQLVASVVNNSGIEIVAYIDSANLNKVAPGNSVIIDNKIKGTVTNVSPSIDPIKKKIEVKIAIEGDDFIVGQFVNINISISEDAIEDSVYLVPLSAVKITSQRTSVFTVKDNLIEEQEVVLGKVIGESIEILQGLDSNMDIVLSVKGLEVGQKVKHD